MSKHLKTRIINRLKGVISYFVSPSDVSALHTRGVQYFVPVEGINALWGAMNTVKEGRRYRKHIIVRQASNKQKGLLQLYTYHFPTHWSAACVANRELIKEAQRQAHELEHDHSTKALEWRIRFFNHYFRVFKGGEKPEPGLKPYSRFYQYTYVAIYRQLQAEKSEKPDLSDLSFEPISELKPFNLRHRHSRTIERIFTPQNHSKKDDPHTDSNDNYPPPIDFFANKFAYIKKKQYLCTAFPNDLWSID